MTQNNEDPNNRCPDCNSEGNSDPQYMRAYNCRNSSCRVHVFTPNAPEEQ